MLGVVKEAEVSRTSLRAKGLLQRMEFGGHSRIEFEMKGWEDVCDKCRYEEVRRSRRESCRRMHLSGRGWMTRTDV